MNSRPEPVADRDVHIARDRRRDHKSSVFRVIRRQIRAAAAERNPHRAAHNNHAQAPLSLFISSSSFFTADCRAPSPCGLPQISLAFHHDTVAARQSSEIYNTTTRQTLPCSLIIAHLDGLHVS